MRYVDLLRTRPIAVETGKANEQHYEVGTDVLQAMLGPRMKYSACLYPKGGETLGEVSLAIFLGYLTASRPQAKRSCRESTVDESANILRCLG